MFKFMRQRTQRTAVLVPQVTFIIFPNVIASTLIDNMTTSLLEGWLRVRLFECVFNYNKTRRHFFTHLFSLSRYMCRRMAKIKFNFLQRHIIRQIRCCYYWIAFWWFLRRTIDPFQPSCKKFAYSHLDLLKWFLRLHIYGFFTAQRFS